MGIRDVFQLLRDTFEGWNEDKAPRLAAALAYYTVFSLAPLLIIAIAIVGAAYGQQSARTQIIGQFQRLMGDVGAQAVQALIQGASRPGASALAAVIGTATLLLGAAGLFGSLQDALNTIWEVKPKPGQGIIAMIRDRFMSFAFVLGTGFLLLVSLIISAAIQGLSGYLATFTPNMGMVVEIVNSILSFIVVTFLFAMIFKILPDVKVDWSDVWIGAVVTALLFTIGKFALSLYLARTSTGSTYGAVGSLIVLLVWVYYAAQILLLGAEFTKVYAREFGSRGVPAENAVPLTEHERTQQGIPHKETVQTAERATALTSPPNKTPR